MKIYLVRRWGSDAQQSYCKCKTRSIARIVLERNKHSNDCTPWNKWIIETVTFWKRIEEYETR